MVQHAIELTTRLAALLLAFACLAGAAQVQALQTEPPEDHPTQPPPTGADEPDGEHEENSDPILLFSGEYTTESIDLRIPGRGFDFVWKRTYRSNTGTNTPQGNRWDHSYNIELNDYFTQAKLVLSNGEGRRDTFEWDYQDLRYLKAGFYYDFDQNPDFSWTLIHPNYTRWRFHSPNASPSPEKIKWVRDRNYNQMDFHYDSMGRLERIEDTLDRDITLTYDAQGMLASVTDFSGRTVTYSYYTTGQPGGMPGDLKSVTYPPVTGTPNGNDFPTGKTWTYTYTNGYADDRLNHCLLTITDPKGQTYLSNTYTIATDPQGLLYQRISQQTYGNGAYFYTYLDVTPDASNNQAVRRTIINDRVGNVEELFYDNEHRLVIRREYTGRADPTIPTTDTDNRPTDKLRAEDPEYFEKRNTFDTASQRTSVIYPNGNTTTFTYDVDNENVRSRGNLLSIQRTPGPLGGTQASLTELYTYDPVYNQLTSHTDARGYTTDYYLDGFGNRVGIAFPEVTAAGGGTQQGWEAFTYHDFGLVATHSFSSGRVDTFSYYDEGSSSGYLKTSTLDSTGHATQNTYVYDTTGNVTAITDGRGFTTTHTLNALNQRVRTSFPDHVDHTVDYYYDANDQIVQIEVANLAPNGTLDPNSALSTFIYYDQLGNITKKAAEVDEGTFAETQYQYDANENVVAILSGEAGFGGSQPTNFVSVEYDERDLSFRTTRGAGSTEASTTQFSYDGNANLISETSGPGALPRTSTYIYDGYDRRTSKIDPEGNSLEVDYDPNGNPTSKRLYGELIENESGANTLLRRESLAYDARSRITEHSEFFFDPNNGMPLGDDGLSSTTYTYNTSSLETTRTDDNGSTVSRLYDSAHRLSQVTDAAGNTRTFAYDANSNIAAITTTDISDTGLPSATFTRSLSYDPLNRLIEETDSDGISTTFQFDSCNNLGYTKDKRGNETYQRYDGLGRIIEVERILRAGGSGSGAITDSIIIAQEWDLSSRLIARTDGNGNTTEYEYDSLDRPTKTTYADGTTHTVEYNVHGDPIETTDANGTVTTATFDGLGRLVSRIVAPAPGVTGTTAEAFKYSGRSLIVYAANDNTAVTRHHDSLANLMEETLSLNSSPPRVVTFSHDGVRNLLSTTYPGGRTVARAYDNLNRLDVITEGGVLLAAYNYIGPHRIEGTLRGNNVTESISYSDTRRVTSRQATFDPGGAATLLEHWTYGWDPALNVMRRTNEILGITHDYDYDSADRLVQSTISNGTTSSYQLDKSGNRLSTTGPFSLTYSMDASFPTPADQQMHQYSTVGTKDQSYDENGNLVQIGATNPTTLSYDYQNRLTAYNDARTGKFHQYTYDALSRRVAKSTTLLGQTTETHYLYARSSVIEEQSAAGVTLATYVLGHLTDRLVAMDRSGIRFYFHQDHLGSVMLLTDDQGQSVEAYDYADFGKRVDPLLQTPLGASGVGNPYGFSGRRFDSETGLSFHRRRYLSHGRGRFLTRDPLGLWADGANLGNPFTYAANNPWTYADPFGLMTEGSGNPVLTFQMKRPSFMPPSPGHANLVISHPDPTWKPKGNGQALSFGPAGGGDTKAWAKQVGTKAVVDGGTAYLIVKYAPLAAVTGNMPDLSEITSVPGEYSLVDPGSADIFVSFEITEDGLKDLETWMEKEFKNPPRHDFLNHQCFDAALDALVAAGVSVPDELMDGSAAPWEVRDWLEGLISEKSKSPGTSSDDGQGTTMANGDGNTGHAEISDRIY